MSLRRHLEDDPPPVRAGRAARESQGPTASTPMLDAAGPTGEPGRGGDAAIGRALGGLHASAGNGAVVQLLRRALPDHRSGGVANRRADLTSVGDVPNVQRDLDDEATPDGEAAPAEASATDAAVGGEAPTELGGGAPAKGPSWTKVGPPSNTTYSVSGSLRTVANAISARTEAGSVLSTPSLDTETWAPPDGTEKVSAARVTVAQVVELPTWSDKSDATPNQQAEWDRFHAAITTHEAGHVTTDKTAFAGAHAKIVGQTPTAGSEALDKVDAQAKTDNATYDATTSHGVTQGTGINPNVDEVTKIP